MALKAKAPEVKEKRLKMFVFGPAGVGKTIACLQFPKAYIIDTERGTDFYSNSIVKAKSVVLQSFVIDDIKEELAALATEKHDYKTLIIDPITQIYNATQEKWNRVFEKYAKNDKDRDVQDFGMRYWGKVKSDFKGLQRLMLALDMNVICTSHQKDVYGAGFSKTGVTFDSMKGDDYLFDVVFRVERKGNDLIAFKVKERAELGKEKFPDEFIWSYDNFLKFYGKEIIEKEAVPVELATKEQIEKLARLIDVLNVKDDVINKWFDKADVESISDLNSEQIQKCIDKLEKDLAIVLPKQKKGDKKDEKDN